MKKIPSLFIRDYEKVNEGHDILPTHPFKIAKGRFLATHEITPGCEWVINGEGVPTRKWDGTAVMIKDGILYKRYDAKQGKTPTPGFVPCQEPDPITGHWPGWLKASVENPSDKYICEAMLNTFHLDSPEGTYEAIGPKIGGNKENMITHELRRHGDYKLFTFEDVPRTYDSIKATLTIMHIEGIVYHHPDGRMCKIKRSDFGINW